MKTLSVLKKDMEFNRGLASLIEVLKNIAVSQYRALEQKLKIFEKFQLAVDGFMNLIDFPMATHPFLRPAKKEQAVIAVTSDSGLLGGLNMQVINRAISELEQKPGQLIVIGERGKAYASDFKVPFVAFPGIQDEQRYEQALQMRDYVINKTLTGAYETVKVVYPRPISFTLQRIETVSLLPFVPAPAQPLPHGFVRDVILESSLDDTIEYLVYLWMGHKFYEIFGLSRLAEFAARYVHLEESLQKIRDMDGKLKLQYFKVRHELIDRNMRELFSARLLYVS
ncbi:MAG: F0F1 ATP synthase subunit gamma [Candidatus Omnitrophica bacterium]|nr:F0F1 ATP synthase subunit gamma [Candidatus Omnitrophota bacterium]